MENEFETALAIGKLFESYNCILKPLISKS